MTAMRLVTGQFYDSSGDVVRIRSEASIAVDEPCANDIVSSTFFQISRIFARTIHAAGAPEIPVYGPLPPS